MGWLDAFTGAAATKAAGVQASGIQKAQKQGIKAIEGGFGDARNQLEQYAIPAVNQGYGDALAALEKYYPEAQGYAGQATAAFDPMITASAGAVGAYGDAAGANGVEGNARAVTNFQAGPGYQFTRDQGLDAINRTAASRGLLASGNNTVDLLKYSTGLADQTWGNYLSRLQPLMQMYGQGIAGRAGGLTNQAQLASGMGTSIAGVNTGRGNALAGIYGDIGNLYGQEGLSRANILTNLGTQIAQTQAGGIMGRANAQAGTIMGGLNLVSKLAGGFM